MAAETPRGGPDRPAEPDRIQSPQGKSLDTGGNQGLPTVRKDTFPKSVGLPIGDGGINAPIPPEDIPPERGGDSNIPQPDLPQRPDGSFGKGEKPIFPNEPHGVPEDHNSLENTYKRGTHFARVVHGLLEKEGRSESTLDEYGTLRREATWSTTSREGDAITGGTLSRLTSEGDLNGDHDKVTLTKRTLISVPGGGTMVRENASVLRSDGVVVEYATAATQPPPMPVRSETPRHQLKDSDDTDELVPVDVEGRPIVVPQQRVPEQVDLPDQREPLSDSFPAIPKAERFAPLQEFEEKVGRADPSEGSVTPEGRERMMKELELRADGRVFRTEHLLDAAARGPIDTDHSSNAAVHGTSLEVVLDMIDKGRMVGVQRTELVDAQAGDIFIYPTKGMTRTIESAFPEDYATHLIAGLNAETEDFGDRARGYAVDNGRAHAVNKALGLPLEDPAAKEWIDEEGIAEEFIADNDLTLEEGDALYAQAVQRKGFTIAFSPDITRILGVQVVKGDSREDLSLRLRTGENGLPYTAVSGLEAGGPVEAAFLDELRTTTDLKATLAKWSQPLQAE